MEATGEKKPARGGLVLDLCVVLDALQLLNDVQKRRTHGGFTFWAGGRLTPGVAAYVVVVCCAVALLYGPLQASAAPPGAGGQYGISISGADACMSCGSGQPPAKLGEHGDAAASVIPVDGEPVPEKSAKQEGQKSNNNPVAVHPIQKFINEHGLIWAGICFVLGLLNGGAFGWPYRR